MNYLRYGFYGVIALVVLWQFIGEGSETEEVEYPTEGLITTVAEVETDMFKIEDEEAVLDTADSRIIAKYMTGEVDTFTLAEARLMQSGTGRSSGAVRAASYGFMGFMMGRAMSGSARHRPQSSAYKSQSAYSKANTAGNRVSSTAGRRTVSRPSGSRSSGGRSTRSFGG